MKTARFPRVVLVALLVTTVSTGFSQPPSDLTSPFTQAEIHGVPWAGAPAKHERTSDIMDRDRRTPKRTKTILKKEHEPPERRGLPNHPDSPAVSEWPPWPQATATPQNTTYSASLRISGPAVASTPSISVLGATLGDTHAFPPDTMGAAGPAQFVVAVNGRIRSFDKNTGAVGPLDSDMDVFFDSVRNGSMTSDPHIRYDRLSGRWFVVIINVANVSNRVLIAMSDSGVITANTVWSYFWFQHDLVSPAGDTGMFADYPTLGIDANALYIGANIFLNSNTFSNCSAYIIRKSSLISGGPIVVTAFRNLISSTTSVGPYTPQGVDNYDPAATTGYFIGVDNKNFGVLDIRRVSSPGGTPTLSGSVQLTVPATAYPLLVPHLGNTGGASGNLDSLDDRLFAAHLRNGHLWTAHNIGVIDTGVASTSAANRDGCRWYDIINVSGTPTLNQSGTIYTPGIPGSTAQANFWMPSIMVTGQGHAMIGFSRAGTGEYANGGFAWRLASDALGTMRAPNFITNSTTAYNPTGDPGGSGGRRWGDYSMTTVDPSDDMSVWTIQEFCNATNSYGVQAVKLLAPPPATPISVLPTTINTGQASVNVTVTGVTDASGAAFFDPGPGFASHIIAVVSGSDIGVNSVTFVDATHVNLNLNTLGTSLATPRTITIANPDGQFKSSATAILAVNPVSGVPNWRDYSQHGRARTTLSSWSPPQLGSFARQPFGWATWTVAVVQSQWLF